jgi:CRP-like cAMP-binding protein
MSYPSPEQNTLLASLPKDALERLYPYLEPVQMRSGDILRNSSSRSHYVYFPASTIISLRNVLDDGSESETGMVGNEGMIGISHILGDGNSLGQAVVAIEGYGFRLKAQLLCDEFDRTAQMRHLLLLYAQARITQVSQRAICNRFHRVQERLCSWLLMAAERHPSNPLIITQGTIANLLGVRREGVTAAACNLQHAGLIHYSRGNIAILDRPGLEAGACECYHVINNEFNRLLPERQTPNVHTTPHGCIPRRFVDTMTLTRISA